MSGVLRLNRTVQVYRRCGHHEAVSVGNCSDAAMRAAVSREVEQPCVHCRLEQNEAARHAAEAHLTHEEKKAALAAVWGDD